MARENTWGYRRISGELKKLGLKLSKSCIADILRPSAVRTGHQNPEVIEGPVGEVECEEFLGGLLKPYHRAAA